MAAAAAAVPAARILWPAAVFVTAIYLLMSILLVILMISTIVRPWWGCSNSWRSRPPLVGLDTPPPIPGQLPPGWAPLAWPGQPLAHHCSGAGQAEELQEQRWGHPPGATCLDPHSLHTSHLTILCPVFWLDRTPWWACCPASSCHASTRHAAAQYFFWSKPHKSIALARPDSSKPTFAHLMLPYLWVNLYRQNHHSGGGVPLR